MTDVYLSLGSNMGNRQTYLDNALAGLSNLPETELVQVSSLYETAAWGKTDQADFLNLVCQIRTDLEPHRLLAYCQQIEQKLDRERLEHWGPRTIDIDLIFYGDQEVATEDLTLPHPYMAERAFVLVPLAELAEDFRHPILGQTVGQLLTKLDQIQVRKV